MSWYTYRNDTVAHGGMGMADLFGFLWDVPETGFQWVKAKPLNGNEEEEKNYLTDGQPLGVAGMVTRYTPLKLYTGLFRTFAETAPTFEGILAFANEYGSLGEGRELIPLTYKGKTSMGTGELLSIWHEEIHAAHRALELWDAAREGNLDLLSHRLAWKTLEDGPAVMYDSHLGLDDNAHIEPPYVRECTWIAAPSIHPELLERFRPGDLTLPALYYVQKSVNEHLKGRISPRLLWNTKKNRLALYMVPSSLIGAIWLQFAQAIDGNKEYRRCEECRTWFELSPETARTSRLYCSNACRSRAYRKRQAEARRLYAEGRSIEDVAKAVGTDVTTAQQWVEGRSNATR